MLIVYLIFTFIVFAGIAGTCVWLHLHLRRSGVKNPPEGRLMILIFTYGTGLYVFLSLLLFFDANRSGITGVNSTTTFGLILEMFTPVLWIYSIFLAPIVILIIGGVSFVKKGESLYHRIVYFACAGYTVFLFALFILMVSHCNPPHGGPP